MSLPNVEVERSPLATESFSNINTDDQHASYVPLLVAPLDAYTHRDSELAAHMVHRPADSRLLTNLLNHEKDYSKHLSILLDYSQAALASFSAYAAASAPPTSQVIIAVAGALSGADDALRNYAAAVERWQEQLKALKTMEDDVGNIMRDREILYVSSYLLGWV